MGVVGMDLNHATPELITSWFYRKNKQIPKVYMIFFLKLAITLKSSWGPQKNLYQNFINISYAV